jgi:hypothetical protein
MAASVTFDTGQDGRFVQGDRYVRTGTLNLGSSYTTGGLAVTKAMFELWHTLNHLEVDPSAGFDCEFDKTNLKVKCFAPIKTYTVTYDPANLLAATARDDDVTVTGILSTDKVIGFEPAPGARRRTRVPGHQGQVGRHDHDPSE